MDPAETKEAEALSLTSSRMNLLVWTLGLNKHWLAQAIVVANMGGTLTFTLAAADLHYVFTQEECQFAVAHLMTAGLLQFD